MTRRALEHRLLVLEQFYASAGGCTCRKGLETSYHDAAELAKIMAVTCAIHGFRDLGDLVRVGTGLPLHGEDQQFCSCPSSPIREFLLGLRGPLTPEEHAAETERWAREYGSGSDEERWRERDSIDQLLRIYEFRKSLQKSRRG
jgi:hypothetical protein